MNTEERIEQLKLGKFKSKREARILDERIMKLYKPLIAKDKDKKIRELEKSLKVLFNKDNNLISILIKSKNELSEKYDKLKEEIRS